MTNTKKLQACELGEGLFVNNADRSYGFVDIIKKKIFLIKKNFSNYCVFDYPYIPSNIFYFDQDKITLLDNFGIADFYPKSKSIVRIYDSSKEFNLKGFRGNDGVKLGNNIFMFGSVHEKMPNENPGNVWFLKNKILNNISLNYIPNSFILMDEFILVADSYKKIIYKHSAKDGSLIDVWSDLNFHQGSPDGGCLGPDSKIYIAAWGAGSIIKLNKKGKIIAEKIVDVPQPSNCKIFGNKLLITSAKQGLSTQDIAKYPNSGTVFSIDIF